MKFSVVIPTRGDIDLSDVVAPYADLTDDIVIWDNSKRQDLAVYARYAAIDEAKYELIMTQDDDVLHAPEGTQKIVDTYLEAGAPPHGFSGPWHVVCNMPANFRHAFYQEHALVGFGACFHRDAPEEAFASFHTAITLGEIPAVDTDFFERTCDIVFTALTPCVLVDVPYEDMPWASAENRMWKQPTHREERGRMLDLVLKVRDA